MASSNSYSFCIHASYNSTIQKNRKNLV
ncbi:hypothetical protein DSQ19_00885 [Candidatus Nitrosotenuis sp. DW1]|nr:hypothetical protein DSQ19_00885 [Candidatus Nitrosotenuis sp. DW1]